MYKSCPFCGSNNICFNFDSETKTYNIQCQKCYARTGYAFTHEKAREAWNQRPYDYDMPAIVKKVQQLEKENEQLKKMLELGVNYERANS
jgi:Lar family restriction alleviation protein